VKVLIAGADGYLGWPTCMRFSARGHTVLAVDSLIKRAWEREVAIAPLVPVLSLEERAQLWRNVSGLDISTATGDICEAGFIEELVWAFRPDVLVDFAQQPSAPFSMLSEEHAVRTQVNNVAGTLRILFALRRRAPDCHLIKLGSMGEYGTPNIDIEEGFLEVEHRGRRDLLPFPKQPGSIYHLSKVHDSHNIAFACKTWCLRVSDLNQGVVYGLETEQTLLHPQLRTSFHYDAIFGTVLNRFCMQALAGYPLTVHGRGGQTRGFLNIVDTLQSIEAVAANPPHRAEYRVFNQFVEQFSVLELSERVTAAAGELGYSPQVQSVDNPRVEAEEHYYNAVHVGLRKLGVQPHLLTQDFLVSLLRHLSQFAGNVNPAALEPGHAWTSANSTAGPSLASAVLSHGRLE
jgi:UDP-sulfoquinovose synthase